MPELLERLRDPKGGVRRASVVALGSLPLNDPEMASVRGQLAEMERDVEVGVRTLAAQVIRGEDMKNRQSYE